MSQSRLPILSIVGRPNVGKSTLFNALTRTRDALVADLPGVTRDRQYGYGRIGPVPYMLIDTGGLVDDAAGVDYLTAQQVHIAIDESDLVIFVVDGRDGLTAADEDILSMLRRYNRPLVLAINKSDGLDPQVLAAEFAPLSVAFSMPVSSAHRRGLPELINRAFDVLPEFEPAAEAESDDRLRLAVIGRPNVGKSTLVNRLLGQERVLACDMPGTTRDTISVALQRDGKDYLLLDTAGVRKRARVTQAVEKFSVIKALQAIEKSHVVVLLIDAVEGLTDQDITLLGHVLNRGRALVLGVNKWDNLATDQRHAVKRELDRRLDFVPFARRITVSALHGSGLGELMAAVDQAYAAATTELPSAELTRVLETAYQNHQPAMKQGRTAKLRYAHMGGRLPPRIVIHGSRTATIGKPYIRYLMNQFRNAFSLRGTPIVLEFRDGTNPYAGRKNKLTQRQLAKRKRLKQFTNRRR